MKAPEFKSRHLLILLPIAAVLAFVAIRHPGKSPAWPAGSVPGPAGQARESGAAIGTASLNEGAGATGVPSEGKSAGKPGTKSGATPGSVGAAVPSTGGVTVPGVAARTVVAGPTCFTMTFHHRADRAHADGEACLHHRNLIQLKAAGMNLSSLCVRVDGKPVRFQAIQKKGEAGTIGLMIGPVAGPHAKITARYCRGKAGCAESCVIPKDEFLDAIGAEEETAAAKGPKAPVKVVQWDPGEQDEGDVAEALDSEIRKELSGGADDAELTVFDGWNGDSETPACGTQDASAARGPAEG